MARRQKPMRFRLQLPVGIFDLCRLFDSVFVSDCLCMGVQTVGGRIRRMHNSQSFCGTIPRLATDETEFRSENEPNVTVSEKT